MTPAKCEELRAAAERVLATHAANVEPNRCCDHHECLHLSTPAVMFYEWRDFCCEKHVPPDSDFALARGVLGLLPKPESQVASAGEVSHQAVAAMTNVVMALALNDRVVDDAIRAAEGAGLPSEVVTHLWEINNAMYRRRLRILPGEREAWARLVCAATADMDSMHMAAATPTEENIQDHARKNEDYWHAHQALRDQGVPLDRLLAKGTAGLPNVEPRFAWRGSVSDLATDIRAVLTKDQTDKLVGDLRPGTAEPIPDPSSFGDSLWFGLKDLGEGDRECLFIGTYGEWMAYVMSPERACSWASVLIDYAAGKPVAAYPSDDRGRFSQRSMKRSRRRRTS